MLVHYKFSYSSAMCYSTYKFCSNSSQGNVISSSKPVLSLALLVRVHWALDLYCDFPTFLYVGTTIFGISFTPVAPEFVAQFLHTCNISHLFKQLVYLSFLLTTGGNRARRKPLFRLCGLPAKFVRLRRCMRSSFWENSKRNTICKLFVSLN